MCVLYVSVGSKVRPITVGCVAMRSAVLFICRSRLLLILYSSPRVEKAKQDTNEAHSLHGQIPAERRLKSRNFFLHYVKHANFPLKS